MSFGIINKSLLKQTGVMHTTPVCSFDVKLKREPMKAEPFTAVEALKLFTPSEAVKMNFVPQMLVAVALDNVTDFVNYCCTHKLTHFKKHNRLLRLCVVEYAAAMEKSYGPAYKAYVNYVKRYNEYVAVELQKAYFTISNVALKQIPDKEDRDLAVYIAMAHRLIDYAESLDCDADKRIAEKLHKPINRNQDKMLQCVTALCIAVEEDDGYKLADNDIDLCIRVLATKASLLADIIIAEETKVDKR
jgi:hypothetical protein